MPVTGPAVAPADIPDRAVYLINYGVENPIALLIQKGITMEHVLSQEFQDSLVARREQYRIEHGLPEGHPIVCEYRFDVNPDGSPKPYVPDDEDAAAPDQGDDGQVDDEPAADPDPAAP